MEPEYHLLSFLLLAIILITLTGYYQITDLRSAQPLYLIILLLLGSVFVDLDHWFDFWYHWRQNHSSTRQFGLSDFFIPQSYTDSTKKAFVIFHGWEWIIGIFICLWWFGWPLWLLALWLGLLCHLALDQLANKDIKPWGYFWTYRIVKKFQILKWF